MPSTTKPSLIRVRTVIGYGSTQSRHQQACTVKHLGTEATKATKRNLSAFLRTRSFYVPEEAAQKLACRPSSEKGAKEQAAWDAKFESVQEGLSRAGRAVHPHHRA